MLLFRILRRTSESWTLHRGAALSASLAFYTLLSLAPVIAAMVTLVAWFLGSDSARHILASRAEGAFGSAVTKTLSATLKQAPHDSGFALSSLFGLAAFLAGASGVAGELRSSLNLVWGVPTALESWPDMLRNRTREILLVFSLLFAVLAVSLASVLISAAGHVLAQALAPPSNTVLIGNAVLSLAVVLFLFLLIHKYVPAAQMTWHNAFVAALSTATLFTLGKELLAVYIRQSTVGRAFGAGQSVIALMLWAYFSTAVLLLGAEFANALELQVALERAPTSVRKLKRNGQMS